jgi:hypothetical protein
MQIASDLTTISFILKHLEKYGIPVPSYALVNREFPYQELDHFIEQEDFVEIHGKRFLKPFVEKPANGNMPIFLKSLFKILTVVYSTYMWFYFCDYLYAT